MDPLDKLIHDQITGECFDKFPHKWEQDYIQPYMTFNDDPDHPHLLWHSWKEVLLKGDQPIQGQYRCTRCQAIGRYQELPPTASYEPVIIRIR